MTPLVGRPLGHPQYPGSRCWAIDFIARALAPQVGREDAVAIAIESMLCYWRAHTRRRRRRLTLG